MTLQKRRINVTGMNEVDKIIAVQQINPAFSENTKPKNNYSLLIENLTQPEMQEIRKLLILSNAVIKEI